MCVCACTLHTWDFSLQVTQTPANVESNPSHPLSPSAVEEETKSARKKHTSKDEARNLFQDARVELLRILQTDRLGLGNGKLCRHKGCS